MVSRCSPRMPLRQPMPIPPPASPTPAPILSSSFERFPCVAHGAADGDIDAIEVAPPKTAANAHVARPILRDPESHRSAYVEPAQVRACLRHKIAVGR